MNGASGTIEMRGWKGWNHPAGVVALWLTATMLHVVQQLFFPKFTSTPLTSSFLYLSALPVLAALTATAIAEPRRGPFGLASALLALDCAGVLVGIAAGVILPESALEWTDPVIALTVFLASLVVTARAINAPRLWRAAAVLAVALIIGAAPLAPRLDAPLYELSMKITGQGDDDDALPEIDNEHLWTAQPALVDRQLAGVDAHSGSAETFLVTIGAGGVQHLFGREARVARDVLGHAFGAGKRSLLLANDEDSLYRVPLADNTTWTRS